MLVDITPEILLDSYCDKPSIIKKFVYKNIDKVVIFWNSIHNFQSLSSIKDNDDQTVLLYGNDNKYCLYFMENDAD